MKKGAHMDEIVAATQEQVLEVAKDVLERGVNGGELTPENATHQVMVLGAMFAVALAIAGKSPDEALDALVRDAMEEHLRTCPEHGNHNEDTRGYL